MSTDTTLTMEELELESAELLPSRETLGCYKPVQVLPPASASTSLSASASACNQQPVLPRDRRRQQPWIAAAGSHRWLAVQGPEGAAQQVRRGRP